MLVNIGYSYAIPIKFGNASYNLIIDTSFVNTIMIDKTDTGTTLCNHILADTTFVNYTALKCNHTLRNLTIENFTMVSNVTVVDAISIDSTLHKLWETSQGVFGINYGSMYHPNIFSFGLDFNEENIESTLSLNVFNKNYENDLVWSTSQTINSAHNHTFFVSNFDFCGISLLSNWSNFWPTVVSTSSSCLVLPQQFYDVIEVWLNSNISGSNYANISLPHLSFRLSDQSSLLYIDLNKLIINASDIVHESGAPVIKLNNNTYDDRRLCILSSEYIDANIDYVPEIVFGSLVLRSLYFAADLKNARVGFANKVTEVPDYSQCAESNICSDDYAYDPSKNSCSDPQCAKYIYFRVSEATGQCEYDVGAFVTGLTLIAVISIFEIFSYFVSQRTAIEYSMYASISESKVDALSSTVGYSLTSLLDFFILFYQKWLVSSDDTDE